MLANARVLGHVFDPLSVFWCFDADGDAALHRRRGAQHVRRAARLPARARHRAAARRPTRRSTSPPSSTSAAATSCASASTSDLVGTTIVLRRSGEPSFAASFHGRPRRATRRRRAHDVAQAPADAAARLGPDPPARRCASGRADCPSCPDQTTSIKKECDDDHRSPPVPADPADRACASLVDAANWPDIARTPRAPLAAAVARALVRRAVRRLPVRVDVPGRHRAAAPAAPTRPDDRPSPRAPLRAARRRPAKIGFGEAYMAGDWEPAPGTDLADLLTPFAERADDAGAAPGAAARGLIERRGCPHTRPTRSTAPAPNIERHYDLSNELFASFLDPTMTYSAALVRRARGVRRGPRGGAAPQDRRHPRLRRRRPGHARARDRQRLGRARRSGPPQRGAQRHLDHAVRGAARAGPQRIAEAGLADRSRCCCCDYREVDGQYDAIVTVEMIEAVGEEFWPDYFATIDQHLAPGGRVALQAIPMDPPADARDRRSYGWIHKYIFPGGLIPSIEAIDESLAEHTSLEITDRRELGLALRATLHRWRMRFLSRLGARSAAIGYDDTSAGCGSSTSPTARPASAPDTSRSSSSRSRNRDWRPERAAGTPSAARRSSSMSSFPIPSIAFIHRAWAPRE